MTALKLERLKTENSKLKTVFSERELKWLV